MRYQEYVPVDIPWIEESPAHWACCRGKRVFSNPKEKNDGNKENNLLSLTLNGVVKNDRDNPIGLAPADYATYQIFEKDDLVFKMIDLENISTSRVGIVPDRGIMSSAYIRFSARKVVNVRYFYYQYYSWWLRNIYNGLGAGVRQTLSSSELLDLKIIVPPREEQDQIVRYLDWKIAKINELIQGYEKEVRLLEEYKIFFTNNTVTRGVYKAKFKTVNSNWISELPESWAFDKVKQHFSIKKAIAGEEGYNVISITQQGLKVKDVSNNVGQIAASYANYQFVNPGEFAMNHMDLLTGYVGLSDIFGVTSPDYRVFVLNDIENCEPEYFLYIFQLAYKRRIFYGHGRGAANKGRWRLPAMSFRNFEIPVPPITEQKEIVKCIKQKENKIEHAISAINKKINYFKEYRIRLISDVVTGQIDVRGVKVPEHITVDDADVVAQ